MGLSPATAPKDIRIERAVRAVRARPADPWTVRSLAKIAGMSRAAFARRFAAEQGAPPLRWLTKERMKRAAALLIETDGTLSRIAVDVGYESEFAFGRAFKRHLGLAPGIYRRQKRGAATVATPRSLALARAA